MRTFLKPWQLYSVLVVAVGLGLASYIKIFNPYPLQVDTDVVKEAIRIQYIIEHGYVGLFLVDQLRPIAYDYIFAFFGWSTGAYASDVMWYSTFVSFPLFGLAVLYFAYGIFKDWPKALIATLFALFICGFWSLEGPAIVLPYTISTILTLFLLGCYLHKNPQGNKQFLIYFILLILLNIGYYYTAFIALPFFIFLQYWPKKRISIPRLPMMIFALAFLPVFFFLFSITFGVNFSSTSIVELIAYLDTSYGPVTWVLFFLGVLLNWKKVSQHPSLIFALLILGILFILWPLNLIALRAEELLRVNVAIIASAGLFSVAAKIPGNKIRNALIIFLVCTPVLVLPYFEWTTSTAQVDQWYGVPLNAFDQNEAAAGLWLRQNGSRNAFVISDIATCEIMQSLSGFNGTWDPIHFLDNLTLMNQAYVALSNVNNSALLQRSLSEIDGAKIFYIVLSSRTGLSLLHWRTINYSSPTWFNLMLISIPTKSDPSALSIDRVYSNGEVEIYETTA